MTNSAVEDMTGVCDWLDAPECDCPHAHLHVDGICVDVHYEPDGSVHVAVDSGDWDDETTLTATSLEDAKQQALAWFIANHPKEAA
jgi:hypothetical protein